MANLSNKPSKGILRTLPSENYARKSAKFDEVNILATLHPPDKDYGHIKIEEDKTPYVFNLPTDGTDYIDTDVLAMKLRLAANTQTPAFGDEEMLSDEEFPEPDEEKIQRRVFERRRKAHYNEYSVVELARKLIREDLIRIGEMPDEESITISTDVSIDETEAEVEEQFSESDGIESPSPSGGVLGVPNIDDPTDIIVIAPKPKDIDELLEESHPCYKRIVKQQQLRQERQKQQQQQENQ